MDRFTYLIDDAEMQGLVADWPAGVGVALCLDADGEVGVVLWHADDPDGLAPRLSEATGWAQGTFAVTPEIEGCPTLRPLFSQAQEFLRLVEGFEGLPDLARAFQDPMAHVGLGPSRTVDHACRITLSEPENDPGLPAGYRRAEAMQPGQVAFLDGELRRSGRDIRVCVTPEKVGRRTGVVRAASVGVRDDFRRFVLDRDTLSNWAPGRAAIIDIPADRFPEPLAAEFLSGTRPAQITITPEGVFVAAGPVSKRRNRFRGALRANLAVGLALGVLSGTVVTALQDDRTRASDALSYRAAEGNSAMNVLESFAMSAELDEDTTR